MKKQLYTLLTFVVILIPTISDAQQWSRRTQFAINPFMVNPAVAGTQNQAPIFATYRSQWTGFKGAPTTMMASAQFQGPGKSGFGAIIINDNTGGAISHTGTELTGAYHVDVNNEDAVSFGLSLNAGQYKFDNSKLVVYDQNDVALNGGQVESQFNFDATFGLMVYGKDYFFGFSIPQLIQSKLKFESAIKPSENRNIRHFQFMGSFAYPIDEQWEIQPSAFMRLTVNTPAQLDLNVRANYNESVWFGLTYRHKDALALMAGGVFKSFVMSYSYDFTTSLARTLSPHSHEVLIGYIIPGKRGKYFAKSALGPRVLNRGRLVK
jgi:type IX secretion system PorP/SprF family membrane protein